MKDVLTKLVCGLDALNRIELEIRSEEAVESHIRSKYGSELLELKDLLNDALAEVKYSINPRWKQEEDEDITQLELDGA